jgi:hypothetical protein
VPDLCIRDDFQQAVGHAEAGPENGHDRDPVGEPSPPGLGERRALRDVDRGERGRRLVGQKTGKLPHHPPKRRRLGDWVAKHQHVVRDERVCRHV